LKKHKKTEKRLERAEKLIAGLFVEGKRWKENVVSHSSSILALIGDIFLAAACISYVWTFYRFISSKNN
jgi:dynein heavy chain